VRVGGHLLPMTAGAAPHRTGDVVTFDRGPLREIYTLALDRVEQDFVVTADEPGDVEVELAIASELTGRSDPTSIRFGCAFGEVVYGEAFLVLAGGKEPIESACDAGAIRLRVRAGQRQPGPVVIDPILTTRSTSASGPVSSPDVAYDATNDRYLVVWESAFSASDHDIFSEMFDGAGDRIVGSGLAIDISSQFFAHPRTADLHAADRFLVATELVDAAYGGRRMVYGRTRDAGGTMALGVHVLLSNPALPGENVAPVVGADPGTDAGPHDWLVVWNNVTSATDGNIQGRAVLANGQPKHAWVLVIEDGLNTDNGNAQVSRSNGNGQVPHPQWLVVYNRYVGSSTAQVFGRTLDLGFNLGNEVPLDDSTNRNLYPQVSSPIADRGETGYLVTYERQGPLTARAVFVRFAPAWRGTNYLDLTAQFGMIGTWLRAESDGVRFVVACQGPFAGEIVLRTLGWTGGGLSSLDGPWSLGAATEPEIAACRASGGSLGNHAVTWLQGTGSSITPKLTRYGGYAAGPMTTVLPTACHGLGIQSQGTTLLGDAISFQLSNAGADVPGFAFGWPAAIPVPICPLCSLGLRLDGPIDLQLGTASLVIRIPAATSFVGLSFAVQGVGVGSGTCYGSLRLSDTVQFTIR
jgi:hypothetical protein